MVRLSQNAEFACLFVKEVALPLPLAGLQLRPMTKSKIQITLVKLALAGIVAAPTAAFAIPGLSTGIKGGLTYSTADQIGYSYGQAWMLGIGADFGAGPIGVMADVFYAKRQVKELVTNYINFTQIFVPVQLRYSIIPMLYVTGGLYYSMGLGQIDSGSGSTPSPAQSYEASSVSKTDFGAAAGVGVSIPAGFGSVLLETRLNYGLKNTSTAVGFTLKTRSVDVVAGVLF